MWSCLHLLSAFMPNLEEGHCRLLCILWNKCQVSEQCLYRKSIDVSAVNSSYQQLMILCENHSGFLSSVVPFLSMKCTFSLQWCSICEFWWKIGSRRIAFSTIESLGSFDFRLGYMGKFTSIIIPVKCLSWVLVFQNKSALFLVSFVPLPKRHKLNQKKYLFCTINVSA